MKGSVMPLMQGRTAKLRRFVGSAHLKNIPTNSSGVGVGGGGLAFFLITSAAIFLG